MEAHAWQNIAFRYPENVPSMLSDEERKYLYWLCAEAWSGKGCVVEIGPWLGGSTVCLAAGMRDSSYETKSMLKVYDNFLWRHFMSARANLPLSPGDSFHPFFIRNTKDYAEIIDCHIQALPDEVVWRKKKTGLPFPIREWLASSKPNVEANLRDIECPYVDHEALMAKYDRLVQDSPDMLWHLISLALWWRKVIAGKPIFPTPRTTP